MWTLITSNLNFFLSFLKSYKKYSYIIGIVAIAVTSSYIGYQVAKAKYTDEKIKALQNLIDQQEQIAQENQEINNSLEKEIQIIRSEGATRIERVIEYVKIHPNINDCKLDDAGLQLWNSTSKE